MRRCVICLKAERGAMVCNLPGYPAAAVAHFGKCTDIVAREHLERLGVPEPLIKWAIEQDKLREVQLFDNFAKEYRHDTKR